MHWVHDSGYYEVVKRYIFREMIKVLYDPILFSCSGNLFHKKAAAYEKDLSPYVMVCGTQSRYLELERSILSGLYAFVPLTVYFQILRMLLRNAFT